MKKNNFILFFILLIFIFVSKSFFHKKDVTTPEPVSPPEVTEEIPPPQPGIWPPPNPKGGVPALAPNFLTKNYYVVFDGSGSMKDTDCTDGSTKAEVAKKAVAEFAKSVPKDANLGLLTFDAGGIKEKLPLGRDNRDEFIAEVNSVEPGGTTPLKSAITQGVSHLTDEARRQLGYGEYHLVIVTDGEAYPQDQNPMSIVDKTLNESPILIHTIGFCIGETHSLNQPGRTIYLSADNPQELARGLKQVLAESEKFDVKDFR